MKYVETSAKTAHNVADAYITMTKDIIVLKSKEELVTKKGIKILPFFYFYFIDNVKINDDKSKFKDLNKSGGYFINTFFTYFYFFRCGCN